MREETKHKIAKIIYKTFTLKYKLLKILVYSFLIGILSMWVAAWTGLWDSIDHYIFWRAFIIALIALSIQPAYKWVMKYKDPIN